MHSIQVVADSGFSFERTNRVLGANPKFSCRFWQLIKDFYMDSWTFFYVDG